MSTLDDADTICIRDISMNSLIYTRQFIINLIILKYLKNIYLNLSSRVRRYRLSKTVRVGENGVEEEDKEELLGSKGTRL